MKYKYIKVEQPIGEFYLLSIPAKQVIDRVDILRRTTNPGDSNVQREYSGSRLDDISQYVTDPDATFPTSIIISVSSALVHIHEDYIEIPDEGLFGEVIDGQHRLLGLKRVPERWNNFDLPVVFMFDLSPEEKAYIFSIINSKQTPVSKSLIADLFGLSLTRSPQKTAHQIARAMNSDMNGPLFKSIKMLGKKDKNQPMEFITQGSFTKYITALISSNPSKDLLDMKSGINPKDDPKRPFRAYWLSDKDHIIQKILTNYFSAISIAFDKDWKDNNLILKKTVGFSALIKALYLTWPRIVSEKRADPEFFEMIANEFHDNVVQEGVELTTVNFPSSEGVANRLAKVFVKNLPEQQLNSIKISYEDLEQLAID